MSSRTQVCGRSIGAAGRSCPELQPCPIHSRKPSSWSPGRDRAKQAKFRKHVLERDSFTCVRCTHHDATGKSLVAHHVRPGFATAAGQTLCDDCHRAVDDHAR